MYIIGNNSCMSCIAHNPSKIKRIYVLKDKKNEYFQKIKNPEISYKINIINKADFLKIHKDLNINDGIVIERETYKPISLEEIIKDKKEKSTLVILDQLTDQNNIGNIFRTSALTGVDGIIIPEYSSAGITSATAKVSTGAVEIINFHITKNIARSIEILKKNNYWIYALDMNGKYVLDEKFNFDRRSVIIVGNEGKGIRKNIINKSDFIISLKQKKELGIDSYNAANSMAIALYNNFLKK